MIESVHIPIYCESEEKKAGAMLTLKTIRVGFPTIPISVHFTGGNWDREPIRTLGFECREDGDDTNDKVIKRLVQTQKKGFAVIDSDVVFFENCEDYETGQLIAGEYIPTFVCPIARATTMPRLHTAFFVVPDPEKLRRAIALFYRPAITKFCPFDPFSPVTVAKDGVPLFYDSCAVLYQAIGGEKFGPDMLRRFEHLYGGSYMNGEHAAKIKACYDAPEKARGHREIMRKYFEEHAP